MLRCNAATVDWAPNTMTARVLTCAGFWPATYTQRPDGTYLGYDDGIVQYDFPYLPTYGYRKTGPTTADFTYHKHPFTVVYHLSFTSAMGGTYVADQQDLDPTSDTGLFTLAQLSTLPVTNASTRVRVERGGQVILGFVVSDLGVEELVFRAVGPTLAQFGVSDAMPNPRMKVYRNGVLVGENDDWQLPGVDPIPHTPSGPTAAFPLPPGSKDAVVWSGGSPGMYTEVVESADGAPGEGLIEAYAAR